MLRQLRLYLDPFVPFRSIAHEADALDYNRRHRGMLLPYARRWAMIALACAGGLFPLGASARVEPILCLPVLGLESASRPRSACCCSRSPCTSCWGLRTIAA